MAHEASVRHISVLHYILPALVKVDKLKADLIGAEPLSLERLQVTDWSISAFWIAKDVRFLRMDNDNSSGCAADFSLRWEHMSEGAFSQVEAQIWTQLPILLSVLLVVIKSGIGTQSEVGLL